METSNNQDWLKKNLKAILLIFFLIFLLVLLVYFLFIPKETKETKETGNIFIEPKPLNLDSLNKKRELDSLLNLLEKKKELSNYKENISKKQSKKEDVIKKAVIKEEEIHKEDYSYLYMYPLWNPDRSRRKLFSSRSERQKFANDHGLLFNETGDSPVKVKGEGEFNFEHDGVIYRFKSLSLAEDARSSMGLSINTIILKE